MITDAEVERVPGTTVYGADGEKIGKAGAVYRDDQSGRPEWMTVQTGLFGSSETFVPLGEATFDGTDLRVPFDKARVKDAPRVDAEGHLDITEEDRLFEHYGMRSAQGSAGQGRAEKGRTDSGAAGQRDMMMDDRRDTRADMDAGGTSSPDQRLSDDEGPRHSAGVGSLGQMAADQRREGVQREQIDVRGRSAGGRDDMDRKQTQTADWRDESGARSASGLSSSPVTGGTDRTDRTEATERRPRLSQWVLVERSSVIEVSPDEAARLAADRGQDTGR